MITNEQSAIAGMFLDPGYVGKMRSFLAPEDFADQQLGQIYCVLLRMDDSGELAASASSEQMLFSRLSELGALDDEIVGKVAEGIVETPHALHTPHYARVIRDDATRAMMGDLAAALVAECQDPLTPVAEIGRDAVNGFSALLARPRHYDQRPLISRVQSLADAVSRREIRRPVYWGLPVVDEFYGGMLPGELHVLAARTSQGKTTLALQVAIKQALDDRGALMVSCEMSVEELVRRWAAGRAGINYYTVRSGELSENQNRMLVEAIRSFPSDACGIYEAGRGVTLSEVRTFCLREMDRREHVLLVVDYINLIRPDNTKQDRHLQIQEITAGLKSLAGELSIPVLALAQMNRQQGDNEEPVLRHLRESGAIEQDADVVSMIWPQDNNPVANVRLKIAKHRHGDTGFVSLVFDKPASRFTEVEVASEYDDPF